MRKRTNEAEVMGAHWKDTGYAPLYQLYSRFESVARQPREQQKGGWAPLRKPVAELYDISARLKVLATRGNGTAAKRETKPNAWGRAGSTGGTWNEV